MNRISSEMLSPRTRSYLLRQSSYAVCVVPKIQADSLYCDALYKDSGKSQYNTDSQIVPHQSYVVEPNTAEPTKTIQSIFPQQTITNTTRGMKSYARHPTTYTSQPSISTRTHSKILVNTAPTARAPSSQINRFPSQTNLHRCDSQVRSIYREQSDLSQAPFFNEKAQIDYTKAECSAADVNSFLRKPLYKRFGEILDNMEISKRKVVVRRYAKGSCSVLNQKGFLDEDKLCGCLNVFGCCNADRVTFVDPDTGQEFRSPFKNFRRSSVH